MQPCNQQPTHIAGGSSLAGCTSNIVESTSDAFPWKSIGDVIAVDYDIGRHTVNAVRDHIVLSVRPDLIAPNTNSVKNVFNLIVLQGDAIVLGGIEDRPKRIG